MNVTNLEEKLRQNKLTKIIKEIKMKEINIKDLDKAAVLAALYNNSRPLGMGLLHFDPKPMTVEEAREIMTKGSTVDYCKAQTTSFDYLNGRVMKVNLSGSAFNPWGYDRNNGEGAALKALQKEGLI
jgi:hypothetical protein